MTVLMSYRLTISGVIVHITIANSYGRIISHHNSPASEKLIGNPVLMPVKSRQMASQNLRYMVLNVKAFAIDFCTCIS
jgi:hypothetical protein